MAEIPAAKNWRSETPIPLHTAALVFDSNIHRFLAAIHALQIRSNDDDWRVVSGFKQPVSPGIWAGFHFLAAFPLGGFLLLWNFCRSSGVSHRSAVFQYFPQMLSGSALPRAGIRCRVKSPTVNSRQHPPLIFSPALFSGTSQTFTGRP